MERGSFFIWSHILRNVQHHVNRTMSPLLGQLHGTFPYFNCCWFELLAPASFSKEQSHYKMSQLFGIGRGYLDFLVIGWKEHLINCHAACSGLPKKDFSGTPKRIYGVPKAEKVCTDLTGVPVSCLPNQSIIGYFGNNRLAASDQFTRVVGGCRFMQQLSMNGIMIRHVGGKVTRALHKKHKCTRYMIWETHSILMHLLQHWHCHISPPINSVNLWLTPGLKAPNLWLTPLNASQLQWQG
jgi:hypothetical protein